MPSTATEPIVHYPDWFDERVEWEMTDKGHLQGIVVESEPGLRFSVSFIDPVRLRQDLEALASIGKPYFADPGLIVIPEVTTAAIAAAVKGLADDGFFQHLKPL